MLERLKPLGRVAAAKTKNSAKWAWHHRTKSLGALGISAGAAERWLGAHDKLPLFIETHRGILLMIFGGLVTLVGFYNSLASFLGWTDDP